MGLECGETCAKYILFLVNLIIFLSGGGLLGFGLWLKFDKSSFLTLIGILNTHDLNKDIESPSLIHDLSIILIVAGAFLLIVGFFGCCGAIKESKCCLIIYGVFLILILLLEIAAVVLAIVYRESFEDKVKVILNKSLQTEYMDRKNGTAISFTWNVVMASIKCCGMKDYEDFAQTPWWKTKKSGYVVPEACCKLEGEITRFTPQVPECPKSPTPDNSYKNIGCYEKVKGILDEHLDLVIAVSCCVGAIELIASFFAFCLVSALNKYSKYQ
jgi:vacuolar-type H+-ATPase subunit I/STV1